MNMVLNPPNRRLAWQGEGECIRACAFRTARVFHASLPSTTTTKPCPANGSDTPPVRPSRARPPRRNSKVNKPTKQNGDFLVASLRNAWTWTGAFQAWTLRGGSVSVQSFGSVVNPACNVRDHAPAPPLSIRRRRRCCCCIVGETYGCQMHERNTHQRSTSPETLSSAMWTVLVSGRGTCQLLAVGGLYIYI